MAKPVLDPQVVRMPGFGPGEWLNTAVPLTKETLHGRVLLIDFWDSTCVNCLRTIPALNVWHDHYAQLGLLIIGVHAPEFRFARQTETVATAVQRLDIQYPVLLDNDFETWTRFANRAWPTKHLVDHQGYIRLRRQGEGYYREIELALRELLRRRDPGVALPDLLPLRPEDAPGAVCYRSTPELHAGYKSGGLFGSALGNPEGLVADGVMLYTLPAHKEQEEGQFYLEGFWQAWPECVALAGTAHGRILLPYRAAGVNAVLSPSPDPLELMLELRQSSAESILEVLQDGRSLTPDSAGADIFFTQDGRSFLRIDHPGMFAIVRNHTHATHTLELIAHARGVSLYTFTFETCLAASNASDEEVFRRR